MRSLVIGICSLAYYLTVILVGFTVCGSQKRTADLERAMNYSMGQTMGVMELSDACGPQTDEALAAMFERQLLVQLTASADYEIRILDADCRKGLLSAEVTERYTHVDGRAGSVTVQKVILLDGETTGTRDARFISAAYYKYDGEYLSEEQGGLSEDSVWRTEEEYAACLARAMQNAGSAEHTARYVSEFTLEEIRDIQKMILEGTVSSDRFL